MCVLLAVVLVAVAWSQASTATVSGTVRDQSGAVLPAAAVALTNTATNVTLKTTANAVGFYIFPGIVPGPYRLSVEAAGMQKFEGTLTVQVQQSAVVNPVLRVGQTATEITVQDFTPMLRVDNPTLGHVLERERIEQLPINGRNVASLLQTVPGMEDNRAYGQKTGSHEMVLDGAAITNRFWGYTTLRRPPGLDTIQEFTVENNNSSAKFTRPTTVVLSSKTGTNNFHGTAFETHRNYRIGTARQRTDTWTDPPFMVRNEFGASAGGPVYLPKVYEGRDRTFWFTSYEGRRYAGRTRWDASVPTEAMRKGDFRGLVDSRGNLSKIYDPWTTDPQNWGRQQFAYAGQPNVIDPNRISPLAKRLFEITPLPTHPNVSPLLDSNWWGVGPDWQREWTSTTRIDHRITDNDRFFARYTQGDTNGLAQEWNLPYLDWVPGSVSRRAPNKSLALSHVRTFSPTFFNEVLASAGRETWSKATGELGVRYADQLGLPNPFSVGGWPSLDSTGLSGYTFQSDSSQGFWNTHVIVDDNATKIAGRHELQFGFHHRYEQLNILPDQQAPQGSHSWGSLATALYDPSTSRTNPLATPYTGHSLAGMFLGTIETYRNRFVRGYYYARSREYALYFQDNYKATTRLTLNLGLRWEYWPAYQEKNHFMTGFDSGKRAIVLGTTPEEMYRLGGTIPAIVQRYEYLGAKFITYKEAGLPQALIYGEHKNFGPRLGVAYRAGDGRRSFVIRSGYRLSYFSSPVRSWAVTMRSNAPTTAIFYNQLNSAAYSPDGIPNWWMRSAPAIVAGKNSTMAVSLEDARSLTRGSASVLYFDPHQPTSRTHDWNFTLEKEVMGNTVARVAYVGNHGGRLDQTLSGNSAVPDYIWYVTTGLPLPTGEYSGVARRSWDQTVYGSVNKFQKSGWSNYGGMQFELERRYTKGYGFQLFYVMGNTLTSTAMAELAGGIAEENQFLPGAVPKDWNERNRFLNYQRDTSIPKHRVRWNWIVDLPFGKGKPVGRNAGGILDRIIGGWQVAGMGSLRSTYFSLPTGIYPNGNQIELYGYKYPIQDCTSGTCYPGYLWWNGYIAADKINSYDPVTGKPNGIMGVPESYKPAAEPLIPWPKNPNRSDPMYPWYGTNTVWVTLKNGTVQRIAYNDNLHPWRQQYFPSTRQWGLDASLFKRIPINERVFFRLNADFFNVLNHPGNPSGIGSSGVLSVRFSGSGARQLQLTLRLTW
ncbi:MAG: carboxypeptidase-like regulatory domain-containing protein [Acidobacteriota bacterium]